MDTAGHIKVTPRSKQAINVNIRWMIERDKAQVLRIEHESFKFAWAWEDFLGCLRQRNCNGMVVEYNNRIIGFMVYELHKPRLHILHFAVKPDYRRQTVGQQMVDKLKDKPSVHRRKEITIEIRETNLAGQYFFHSQEFRAKTVLRGYYEDEGEDGYLMVYRLQNNPEEEIGSVPHNRFASYW